MGKVVRVRDGFNPGPAPQLRVVLADSCEESLEETREALTCLGFADIVAQATDGAQTLRFVRRNRPDLVIMEVKLRKINGLAVICRIKEKHPEIRVLVLTSYGEELRRICYAVGADGFLKKEQTREWLWRELCKLFPNRSRIWSRMA